MPTHSHYVEDTYRKEPKYYRENLLINNILRKMFEYHHWSDSEQSLNAIP